MTWLPLSPTIRVAFLVLAISCLPVLGFAALPNPGEQREVFFTGADGEECVIAFRWCPPGRIPAGDPASPSSWHESEGFWISETEVSLQQFECIAGHQALQEFKEAYFDKPGYQKTGMDAVDQQVDTERAKVNAQLFGNTAFPVNGVSATRAEAFCDDVTIAFHANQDQPGHSSMFSTFQFRLPTHFEWQYACRGLSGRKHFVNWPANPARVPAGDFENYREFLRKEDPDAYEKHRVVFDSFDGTEDAMIRLLTHQAPEVRDVATTLLGFLLDADPDLKQVTSCEADSWGIRGMHGNVAEWVLYSEDAHPSQPVPQFADRTDNGNSTPQLLIAGSWAKAQLKNVSWERLSIWHWQNLTRSAVDASTVGQPVGIRLVMTDAVTETWFADLRQMANESFLEKRSTDELAKGVRGGIEVSERDKEGATIADARIGIYDALVRSMTGDDRSAVEKLRDSATTLGESGDDYFAILASVIDSDDFHPRPEDL